MSTYPPSSGRPVLALVLGILSIVGCGCLGPFAWWIGSSEREAIRDGRSDPSGQGMATAGMILGIIATALIALSVIGILLFMLLTGGVAVLNS